MPARPETACLVAPLATLLTAASLLAQDAPVTSLADALRRARTVAPAADLARAQVAIARGRTREETQWANPEFTYRREDLAPNTDVPGDIFTEASVPLPVTGRRIALRGAGVEGLARARADSTTIVAQLEADVATAWWSLVRAEALAEVTRSYRAAVDSIAVFDSLRAREGAIAEVIALRARVEADRAVLAEVTASAELARARAVLAQLLALPGDALAPVARTAYAQLLPPMDGTPSAPVAPPRRPELLAAEAAEREARRRAQAAGWAAIPDFTLTGGTKQTGPLRYAVFAVGLPIPLFNRNGGARERAAGELLAAGATRRAVEQGVAREAEAANAARLALRRTPPPAQLAARAADAAQIARAAYREGGIGQLELLEAQRADLAAREAIVRWAAEVRLADVAWRRATGQSQETP
jgi:cobalt-zinc-cadmium efflux system outer membrane protein